MRTILLDTNIILDVALVRREHYPKARDLMKLIANNSIPAFVTASAVTDIYYLLQRPKGHQHAISFLEDLFDYINIASVDYFTIINALNSKISDFEDAVQVESAKQVEIGTIITRNKDDFKYSGLDVYLPHEFIDLLEMNRK